jgi:hypothetical protein
MVWICNPLSGAMPAGNAKEMSVLATGALAANNSASVGLATNGAAAGADSWAAAGGFAGASARRTGFSVWATNMPAEMTSEAASANHRPRPLANRSLRTKAPYCRIQRGLAILAIVSQR